MLFPLTSSNTEAGKAKIHTLPGILAAWGDQVNLSWPVRPKWELLVRLQEIILAFKEQTWLTLSSALLFFLTPSFFFLSRLDVQYLKVWQPFANSEGEI